MEENLNRIANIGQGHDLCLVEENLNRIANIG
jgi:hypothetical protein